MVDLIKKAFYTGPGPGGLTKEKAEELVKDLAEQAKLSEHEGKDLVENMMRQSDQRPVSHFQAKIDESVQAVVKRLNLASKDEVASLKAKIDELSAKLGQGQGTGS